MEGREADKAFHAALLAATANPFVISLTNGVTAAVNALTEFKLRLAKIERDPVPDHLRVYDAIAAKDRGRRARGDGQTDSSRGARHARQAKTAADTDFVFDDSRKVKHDQAINLSCRVGGGRVPDRSGLGAGADGSAPVVSGARPATLESIKVHGSTLVGNLEGNSVDRDVLVFLPPGYGRDRSRRYPVLYALHGYSIGAQQWSGEIHVPQTIEGAFASAPAK